MEKAKVDILATSMINSAAANAMYSTTFLLGVLTMGAGLLSMWYSAATNRPSDLGMALMMIGAGLAGPSLLQIFMKVIDLKPAEIPTWLPVLSNVFFPLVACGSGVYSLYRHFKASPRTSTAQG